MTTKPTKTLDEVRKPEEPKTLEGLLNEARDCIKVVEPLLPGGKLTLRRELVLLLCNAVLELAKPCEHESTGALFSIAQGDTITDDQLDVDLWRHVADDEPAEPGEMHLCARCGCVFWVPTI